MPYNAKAIANAFINRALEDGYEIKALKLQKLVYFAAGYYCAAYDRPLLDTSIEAWEYGPIVPSLYYEFRKFGAHPITQFAMQNEFLRTPYVIPINEQAVMNVIDFVWRTYKDYSGLQLSAMANAENTLWKKVRNRRKGIKNPDIDEKNLKDYFKPFIKNFAIPKNYNKGI